MKKLKSEKGFTTADATVAIIIITLSLSLIATLVYNSYVQVLSTHKSSMATFYAVQILEKVNKLEYYDVYLQEGTTTKTPEGTLLDIPIDNNYNATLNIQDYNKQEGNEDKQDLIKTVEVIISYTDNSEPKNISIKTLKLNM